MVPPEFAPIVVVPAEMQFANPATLGAFATVATGADDELQWLFNVMSCVLLSLNVPVATKACVLPIVLWVCGMECRWSPAKLPFRLSIGTAEWRHGKTLDEMLDAADRSMYEEKKP